MSRGEVESRWVRLDRRWMASMSVPAVTDEIRATFGASCETCDPKGAHVELFP